MIKYLSEANQIIGERLIQSKKALAESRLNGTKCKYVYSREHEMAVGLIYNRYRVNVLKYGKELAEQYKIDDMEIFLP